MIAGAKYIDSNMVGLVYTFNTLPSFMVKLTGPYWFHLVSYKFRMVLMTIAMASSFITVASGYIAGNVWIMLFGIAIGSFQSGLGEASFLALAAFYDGRVALTAWSSGTGFAGIFGYAWVVFFTVGLNSSFATALYFALTLAGCFALNCFCLLTLPELDREKNPGTSMLGQQQSRGVDRSPHPSSMNGSSMVLSPLADNFKIEASPNADERESDHETYDKTSSMTPKQRLAATWNLWPYMIPLFVVYFAEYTMQSGVWSAFGCPVSSQGARNRFYEYANWCYQAGVLVSRSSGTLWKAEVHHLWVMPTLQVLILLLFLLDAYYLWWDSWSILTVCFVVGLLGGAVYVNGFSLISENVPEDVREFSLSTASIADSCGIISSTLISIAIQQSIYNYHDINDD
jgi:battenin